MRIAVDAMGGDHAPQAILHGARMALREDEELKLVLVGRRDVIERQREAWDSSERDRAEVIHAADVIGMDEPPVDGLRSKKDSSLATVARLGASREVDAVISAGNTGAFATACQLKMRPLRCVDRPGIAVTIPAFHGPFVICDVGANIQARPRHLYEYAVMASMYALKILGIEDPRVAVLSVGEESEKGTRLVKQTHELLEADERIRFVGNVEGRDLFHDRCDVAVCDGFVGNIILKLVEGLAEGLFRTLAHEVREEPQAARLGMEAALDRVWKRHDYSEYGGAPLLGIDGVSVVCHGRSEARAIANAIKAAKRFVTLKFNEAIHERLAGAVFQG